ncbi:MAG: hypothetical protein HQ564_03275 [Candidatus Saganbacteria bacterium]|nr:hypothetical protein [Candidatus Saganbacteria bacterium]
MEEKKPICCSNPELGHLDDKSSKSLRNFVVWFLVVFIIGIVLLFTFKDFGPVKHLFMSPQEMKQHTNPKGGK